MKFICCKVFGDALWGVIGFGDELQQELVLLWEALELVSSLFPVQKFIFLAAISCWLALVGAGQKALRVITLATVSNS
jgi:hypothetical protein